MLSRVLVLVGVVALARAASVAEGEEGTRDGKLFPVMQIVTFENNPCEASNGEHGICYSQKECQKSGGQAMGTCANGFGVCCVMTATCDGTITVNASVFQSPGHPGTYSSPGLCTVDLIPPEGTCQILLQFEAFNIMGPFEGDCGNDTFVVMGANEGSKIPVICGYNSGQHMYIDIDNSDGPYKLIMTLSPETFGRIWKIKVIFIGENDPCKAPNRCLQYFRESSGTLSSFNFNPAGGSQMLNNQMYGICFAYLPGLCDIGFSFSRFDFGNINQACANDFLALGAEKICGDFAALAATANATSPIVGNVMSDSNNEREEEGFYGTYMMMPC